MFDVLTRIIRTGVVTETLTAPGDAQLAQLGITVQSALLRQFSGSIAIRQVDAGSCNGCELEIHALNNPYYDVEQYGVHFVASPRHADVLLVTGPVSRHMETALRRTYDATPAPKWVIAAGDCACHGGEFGVSYAICGAVQNVIPVDVKIPGCPPSPVQLLTGILSLLQTAAKGGKTAVHPQSGNEQAGLAADDSK